MPTITIDESGCRACNLCVEICPTDVLAMDDAGQVAKVVRQDDCIGCTSCKYLCPSRCLDVGDYSPQRPFFRIEENERIIERFLQKKPVGQELTQDDWAEALRDVSVRLKSLADSVTETMGRGQKAAGRKAGQLAAAHLPEMYEDTSLDAVLTRMSHRFKRSFTFEHSLADGGKEITLKFAHCALNKLVTDNGEKIGDSLMCQLFHEYWAGLLGAFVNNSYSIKMEETGDTCTMKLLARK
jgi:NAD-dependent dihydropyrimidine dehydrogenase PreA subunit